MGGRRSGVWSGVLTVGLGLALGAPAGAEIYHWRTADGGFAFTDDPKNVPARYQDDVEVRPDSRLSGYRRYTPKDDQASRTYEERLAARLERLRALNEDLRRDAEDGSAAAAGARSEQITLRTGRNGSGIEITAESTDEPLVVETILVRPEGSAVAQPMRVTRQGDRILAVEKPRRRQWNVLSDQRDEDDLLEGRR